MAASSAGRQRVRDDGLDAILRRRRITRAFRDAEALAAIRATDADRDATDALFARGGPLHKLRPSPVADASTVDSLTLILVCHDDS